MRQSSLLKWTQRNKNGHNKQWIHPPEALKCGHIAYLVKFLGYTDVDLPKGIEVIKEGIRKLKFNQQLRRSEGGSSAAKIPKVEVTVSIDGVAIQEPKTKRIAHQYPLHRISYCADDKSDKKFFSFIAKEEDSDKHTCYVFVSDKLAEEITLTIGQAFELAYRRFLDTSGRDLEMKKQLMVLQKKVQSLENENHGLHVRINELDKLKDRADIESYKKKNNISDLKIVTNGVQNGSVSTEKNNSIYTKVKPSHQNNLNSNTDQVVVLQPPPIPPRITNRSLNGVHSPSQDLCDINSEPEVGRKLENLALEDLEDFNPRGDAVLSPESKGNSVMTNGVNGNHIQPVTDLFGAKPFSPRESEDPFQMGKFEEKDLENAIGVLDRRLSEMRDGFSRGLSFGNDDFSLDSLDPLKAS